MPSSRMAYKEAFFRGEKVVGTRSRAGALRCLPGWGRIVLIRLSGVHHWQHGV